MVEVDEAPRLPEDEEGDRRPGDGEHDPAWDGVAEEEPPHAPPATNQEPEVTPHPGYLSPEHERVAAREVVSLEEAIKVDGTSTGQAITELNTVQLRALAKARGIRLGTRKDKRDAMLQALREGE